MVFAMKAIQNRMQFAGGGSFFSQMAMFMRVNLQTLNKMDMAHIFQPMETTLKVIGKTKKNMAMVSKPGQISLNMKDITKKIRNTESALKSGLMDPNTAAAGSTTKFQELVRRIYQNIYELSSNSSFIF